MKKFVKNNQSFICIHCGTFVEKHSKTSTDHCNHCLYSLHVDINPGDRANKCKGRLKPIGLKIANSKTQIVYNCLKCGSQVYCIASQDDNPDELLALSTKVWQG